jgi:glycosyltransferase involved in cell wall biosynthesis
MEKVSVIIPTFNRFIFLLNTINSIKNQTYPDIEIIIINDRSTQKEYYNYNWDNVTIIHLEKNSKEIFGFPCTGFVRNQGIKLASGNYIAFCDDDDIWFPNKIELQVKAMKETGCKMSSTESLIGNGPYNPNNNYKKYYCENYFELFRNEYQNKGSNLLNNGFPDIYNLELMQISNCMMCSSVIIEKELLNNINNFNNFQNGKEDYDCWLRALKYTDSAFIKDVCVYYDNNHGNGQNY